MKKPLAILCVCLMTALFLTPFIGTENALGQEKESTWPDSVAVDYGIPTGIVDFVTSQDGVTYSVAEEDVGVHVFQNDTLNPDGAGTHLEWEGGINTMGGDVTCGVGVHWGCEDEGPPVPGDSDLTYTYHSARLIGEVDVTDTYSAQDYAFPAGYTIDEVRVSGTAKFDLDLYAVQYEPCVLSGITLDCIGLDFLTVNYVEYEEIWTLNPDDGLAWEDADIDALEIGHHGLWDDILPVVEARSTLLFATVQSSILPVDYTADYQFDFLGIDHKYKPVLEVAGYRTGDAENIRLQVLREGAWSTLSANAFTTGLSTVTYELSTADVIGGVASVRIVDADPTDNTQTTIYIDEILIRTEGTPPGPGVPITVTTESIYDMWGNRLEVNLFWHQSGGPEPANVISKFIAVYIDGAQCGGGFITIPLDKNMTYVSVPWNVLDGALHNATIFGYVVVAWTTGFVAYRSDAENIQLNNFPRWIFLVLIFLIVVIILVIVIMYYFSRREDQREYLRKMERRREAED